MGDGVMEEQGAGGNPPSFTGRLDHVSQINQPHTRPNPPTTKRTTVHGRPPVGVPLLRGVHGRGPQRALVCHFGGMFVCLFVDRVCGLCVCLCRTLGRFSLISPSFRLTGLTPQDIPHTKTHANTHPAEPRPLRWPSGGSDRVL